MTRLFTPTDDAAPVTDDPGAGTTFLLHGPEGGIEASGIARPLTRGGLDTLADRVAKHFAQGWPLLVGAIPFDRAAPDYLFSPRRVTGRPRFAQPPVAAKPLRATLAEDPPARAFRAAVAGGLDLIRAGALDKIVLSRCLLARGAGPIATGPLLAALRQDASVTQFSTRLPAGAIMLGATPELLLAKRGGTVASHPLAGSAPRSADPAQDEASGLALLRSDKDRREHALAAEAVLDALAPFCAELPLSHGIALRSTARMWHLGTRIEGRLRDPDTPVAQLLAALHPTPAVCGHPRAAAARAIAALEGYDRGFYAGAVGWMDSRGDGEWHVTLRCAEISGHQARLFAGAGIVAGSTPEGEEAETRAKFRTMLDALGINT